MGIRGWDGMGWDHRKRGFFNSCNCFCLFWDGGWAGMGGDDEVEMRGIGLVVGAVVIMAAGDGV